MDEGMTMVFAAPDPNMLETLKAGDKVNSAAETSATSSTRWNASSGTSMMRRRWKAPSVERVRPKMMTVAAIMAGLLPIMWSHGTGAEVMQRIAVPMIGGMVSSTMLTLVVIPAIYAVVKGIAIRTSHLATVFQ
jgi:Cu(I)/Ag(I) efflux system membrane protein CusA/SilA